MYDINTYFHLPLSIVQHSTIYINEHLFYYRRFAISLTHAYIGNFI